MTIRRMIILLSVFAPLIAAGQLTGVVLGEHDKPLTGAHVWLSGTSTGGQTDVAGRFILDAAPGRYTLIVTHLGFVPHSADVLLTLEQHAEMTVRLARESVTLSEITIQANASKKRKRWLNQFEKGFFGYTSNAKHCRLRNPEVLLFEEDEDGLKAVASDLLIIENQALGYEIQFLLEDAVMQGSAIRYQGKPLFRTLTPADDNQARRWEKAREVAYAGSLRHFLRALAANDLKRAGFEIHHSIPHASGLHDLGAARVSRIVKQHPREPDVLQLSFEGFLKVTYLREKNTVQWQGKNALGNVAGSLGHRSERSILQNDMQEMTRPSDDQVTYLFLRKVPVLFDTEGNVLEPQYLEEHGYLGHERIADLLPLEYVWSSSPASQ